MLLTGNIYNKLVDSNNHIDQELKSHVKEKLDILKNKAAFYRKVEDVIETNKEVLYALTTNLPAATKLINISEREKYAIEKMDDVKHVADDGKALKGTVYHVHNIEGETLFYGEGTVKFLFKEYSFIGSMYVKYESADNNRVNFEAEVYVYPDSRFARGILKLLLKLGFGRFADKKIMTIHKKVNNTAIALKKRPFKFNSILKSKYLCEKHKISSEEKVFMDQILMMSR